MPSIEMVYKISRLDIVSHEDILSLFLQKGYALTASGFDNTGTIKLKFWKSNEEDRVSKTGGKRKHDENSANSTEKRYRGF